ncbi:hypothetical protein EUU23_03165 [Sphingorhabdus sp. IMCC26285]|jgi:hypothetical protein|uniref:Lipoprotein n=1 Tax=Sphingorhabdus profundilacus TaxID=2509718 RepID=A0A6I4M317_9SPHN|nr:MalM family protein [Sphingorhabdus profundilacus]MVZ96705.1 hypothetical protein [Sphingorhabdus profundilacus]
MKKVVYLAASCALLASCASGPGFSSPVTKFAGVNCLAKPDLTTATSLEFKKKKKFNELSVPVVQTSKCLSTANGDTPFQLFAIPGVTQNRVFEIGSAVEPLRVFSPDIATLDGNGNVVRRFSKDQFAFRGGVYSVQMRALENEKFVLVTTAPQEVGKFFDSIQTSTSTTSVYTGFGAANWTNGVDRNYTRAFSYEGTIIARVVDTTPSTK